MWSPSYDSSAAFSAHVSTVLCPDRWCVWCDDHMYKECIFGKLHVIWGIIMSCSCYNALQMWGSFRHSGRDTVVEDTYSQLSWSWVKWNSFSPSAGWFLQEPRRTQIFHPGNMHWRADAQKAWDICNRNKNSQGNYAQMNSIFFRFLKETFERATV